ncbi:MAG: AmmeMemoRadiSam system protein A [bacterium]|nr:AmmeMemoRadiSam system protein A [bacterium]
MEQERKTGLLASFIVPHPPLAVSEIGNGREQEIVSTLQAYRQVAGEIAQLSPDTIIVISPHSIMYADYFHISPGSSAVGDFRQFGAGQVKYHVSYDEMLVQKIADEAWKAGVPAGTQGERDPKLDHGTMVPLYFIDQAFQEMRQDYQLVRIGLSGESPEMHYRFGQCIGRAAAESGKRIVLVASGDLSHKLAENGPYGYTKEGPKFDRQVTEAMKKGDFLSFLSFDPVFCEAAAECGLGSFRIMAGAWDGRAVESTLLSYEGPFGVGYAVASYYPTGEKAVTDVLQAYLQQETDRMSQMRKQEDTYVQLARKSVECYVNYNRALKPEEYFTPELTEELHHTQAGAFVSLKKNGKLRGCIGTILPTRSTLAEEIVENGISACSRDPRFLPVTPEELKDLVYSVDVLSAPERISSAGELDVKRYGVIVTQGSKRGLLLPNLDGVDTIEEQIGIASDKAGIKRGSKVELQRFEVVRHH